MTFIGEIESLKRGLRLNVTGYTQKVKIIVRLGKFILNFNIYLRVIHVVVYSSNCLRKLFDVKVRNNMVSGCRRRMIRS